MAEVRILGEYDGDPFELTISASPTQLPDQAVVGFRIKTFQLHAEYTLCFLWEDLRLFARSLARLHEQLRGAATLGQGPVLSFVVADPGCGRVRLGGYFDHVPAIASDTRTGSAPGLEVRFSSVMLDQSYLPGIVRQLTELLNEDRNEDGGSKRGRSQY